MSYGGGLLWMLPDEEKMKSLTKLRVLFPWEYTKDVELCQYRENSPKGRGRGHGHITRPPPPPLPRGPLGMVFSELWYGTWLEASEKVVIFV